MMTLQEPGRLSARARYDQALLRARLAAYPPGEFVGQESFMCASEILRLGTLAGIAPGVSVLDLCCGVAGPGLLISRELGCSYVGVDEDPDAVDIARQRAAHHAGCRFVCARVPPVPRGPYDVVLLLETMLAFPDKGHLLQEIVDSLETGGRFAFTVEEGRPLSRTERVRMPASETVCLLPLPDLLPAVERAGLQVLWQGDCTRAHHATAAALRDAFAEDAHDIAMRIGRRSLDDLLTSHQLWCDWLAAGRVRKLAFVAEKTSRP